MYLSRNGPIGQPNRPFRHLGAALHSIPIWSRKLAATAGVTAASNTTRVLRDVASRAMNNINPSQLPPLRFARPLFPSMFHLLGGAAVVVYMFGLAMVPAGSCGIVDCFGVVSQNVLPPGLHIKNPFARVLELDLRTQLLDSVQDVPTSEGLIVHLEVSVLYHVMVSRAVHLYSTVGENYRDVLLSPEVRSTLRNLTSESNAKALYSNGRNVLSGALLKELNNQLGARGIVVEQVLLRNIQLPQQVTAAIEEKLKAEQESQRMEFVLLKERQEAERKSIEAAGIADFQRIVTAGISKDLLAWKGIEATEKLAASNNAKVVFIGNSGSGMPLILGPDGMGARK